MRFREIGFLRTPFTDLSGMPIQPAAAHGVAGALELSEDLAEGLLDLDGFSHIYVLYCFHEVTDVRLTVIPFLDSAKHGVFATRAPTRPNPIGLSLLRIRGIKGTTIEVEDVDMLDGTPVLDIKPYVPSFDTPQGMINTGWLDEASERISGARSDSRFVTSSTD
jgi:tRNA-Thr(GGU) m(6)t(6)A37 methyltransferase TsaA